MKSVNVVALVLALTSPTLPAAVRGDQVMYVGGTFSSVPEKTEGNIDTSKTDVMLFNSKKRTISVPFSGITSIEYGQKAGRRIGVAVAVSPLALLSKKRKHYVSLSFKDASGVNQGVVFEVAKGVVGPFVRTLEQRSGKTVEFESADAKKHFEKESK